MRFVDISPAVRGDTRAWPGGSGFALEPKRSIGAGDSVA